MRQLPRLTTTLLLILCCLLGAMAQAEAKVKFKIDGRGFGHGVGMSQWGAYGFAKQGRSARQIVTHYYKGAKLGKTSAKGEIRVLLSIRDGDIRFRGAKGACGKSLDTSKYYRAEANGKKLQLSSDSGKRVAGCGSELRATAAAGGILIAGDGTYRGQLNARVGSSGLLSINKVLLDDYIKGVIPNESPASWPAAALQAQAIVARSYALATNVGGSGFDQYDDTRSQVYGGKASEESSTNRAAAKTSGQVMRAGGEVIPTFFFSTSGGRTENVEFGFLGGSPRPYLKSVRDPYDDASPYHKWSLTLSRKQMESRLGDLVAGKLKRIKVLKTGVSPRIVKARVVGSGGTREATGPELRARLGLKSTWAKFKRVRR